MNLIPYISFSAKIKEKYPQYKGVDDRVLAEKFVEKYPQYKKTVLLDEPEPVKMSDEQLRKSLTVSQPEEEQTVIEAPEDYYNRKELFEKSRQGPLGRVIDAAGSAALGYAQGATGGAAKKTIGAMVPRGEEIYKSGEEASPIAYTIGDLIGGITTGKAVGGYVSGLGPVKNITAAVGSKSAPAGKILNFITRSTSEGLPWITKAGFEEGAVGAAKEAGINLATDAILGGVGKAFKYGGKKLIPTFTRTSEGAMESFSTPEGKKLIREMAGKGEDFVAETIEKVDELNAEMIPEYRKAVGILKKLPPMKKGELIDDVRSMAQPDNIGVNEQINKFVANEIKKIESELPDMIAPDKYKEVLNTLTESIRGDFGKSSNRLKSQIKGLRNKMKTKLENVARASGREDYIDLMKKTSEKLNMKNAINRKLGAAGDSYLQADRIERFYNTLHHKGKTGSRRLVDDIGELFGNDTAGKANALRYARELGIDAGEKYPSWFNKVFMRSLIGGISGGATLGILGGLSGGSEFNKERAIAGLATGFSLSSPRIGATIYEALKRSKVNSRDVAKIRHLIEGVTKED